MNFKMVTSMTQELIERFHYAMLGIYDSASKLKKPYYPHRFIQMVNEYGGKEAADRLLLPSANYATGLGKLFEHGGPDALRKSVEYLVLSNPWRVLFTDKQLAEARKRLNAMGMESISLPIEDSL